MLTYHTEPNLSYKNPVEIKIQEVLLNTLLIRLDWKVLIFRIP